MTTENTRLENLYKTAKMYIEMGVPITPVWGVDDNLSCRCGNKSARHKHGKHPQSGAEWQKDENLIWTVEQLDNVWDSIGGECNFGAAWGHPLPDGRIPFCWDIDVDENKKGADTMQSLAAEGKIFPTTLQARTGGGGLHNIVAAPAGTDIELLKNKTNLLPGIDIRGIGGQSVIPFSLTDKGEYSWENLTDIIDSPEWVMDLLKEKNRVSKGDYPKAKDLKSRNSMDDAEIQAADAHEKKLIDRAIERLESLHGLEIGESPGWNITTWGVSKDLLRLANSPWSKLTPAEAAEIVREHAPRDYGFGDSDIETCIRSAEKTVRESGEAEPQPTPANGIMAPVKRKKDIDIWNTRKDLKTIHDYAKANRCNPYALLGTVLTMMITHTDKDIYIEGLNGAKISLNTYLAIYGQSGSGKGRTIGVAERCLNLSNPLPSLNFGSGEGLSSSFMSKPTATAPSIQYNENSLFVESEGEGLKKLASRSGAINMTEIRKGYYGESLGQQNRQAIICPAHAYRLGIIVCLQPTTIDTLMSKDQIGGGTPQRFLWFNTQDLEAPKKAPAQPMALLWSPPTITGDPKITLPTDVLDAWDDYIYRSVLGEVDEIEGHLIAQKVKMAAALAILDRRWSVNMEDWQIACDIVAESTDTRLAIEFDKKKSQSDADEYKAWKRADEEIKVDDLKYEKGVARVAIRLFSKFRGQSVNRRAISRYVSGDDRNKYLDGAIEQLVDDNKLVITENPGGKGEVWDFKQ